MIMRFLDSYIPMYLKSKQIFHPVNIRLVFKETATHGLRDKCRVISSYSKGNHVQTARSAAESECCAQGCPAGRGCVPAEDSPVDTATKTATTWGSSMRRCCFHLDISQEGTSGKGSEMLLGPRGPCLPVTVLADLKFLQHRATPTAALQHGRGVRLCPTAAQSLCASVLSSA